MWKTANMRSPASSDLPRWPRLLSPPARRSSVPPHRPRAREARDGRPRPQSQPPAFVPQRGRCQRDSYLQGRCSDPGRATQTAWENPGITKTQGEKGLGEMQGIRISFIWPDCFFNSQTLGGSCPSETINVSPLLIFSSNKEASYKR